MAAVAVPGPMSLISMPRWRAATSASTISCTDRRAASECSSTKDMPREPTDRSEALLWSPLGKSDGRKRRMSAQATPVRSNAEELLDRHRETLDAACAAIGTRAYWSAYPEMPKAYGEEAPRAGQAAFEGHLGQRFALDQPADGSWGGEEGPPYGTELGVTYPHAEAEALIQAAAGVLPAWRDAGVEARVGVALEILARLN